MLLWCKQGAKSSVSYNTETLKHMHNLFMLCKAIKVSFESSFQFLKISAGGLLSTVSHKGKMSLVISVFICC